MSDISEDFHLFLNSLQKIDVVPLSVQDVSQQIIFFFQKLHVYISALPLSQRKTELERSVQAFHPFLQNFIEATKLSESTLLTLELNRFTREEIDMIEEAKKTIIREGQQVAHALLHVEAERPKEEGKPSNKKFKKPHKPPRSSWMKS